MRRMLPAGTVRQPADDPEGGSRYYLRIAKDFADRFPSADRLAEEEDCLRLLSWPVRAELMHGLARQIRKEGGRIAFAALDPSVDPEE